MSAPTHAPQFGDTPAEPVNISPQANGEVKLEEVTTVAAREVPGVAGVVIKKGLTPEKSSRSTKWNLVANAIEVGESVDVPSSGMAQSCRKAIQALYGKGSAQSYKLNDGSYRVFRVA